MRTRRRVATGGPDDVRSPEAFVEHFLTEYTEPGDSVDDVAKMKHEGRVAPLAWDVADRVSNVFHFDGEVVVTWEGDGGGDGRYGYDHSYCLVFTKADG